MKIIIEINPSLASEWHPTKNNHASIHDEGVKTSDNVWWMCSKGHEWQATVNNRISRQTGCPVCANRKVWVGFNDLATTHPEIAKDWHPTKNGALTPSMITAGSSKRVWWQCEAGHEWNMSINNRTIRNNGCPMCSNRKVVTGFNDLTVTHPELAAQWHPTKNGDLTPRDVTCKSNKRVWWLLPYDDPKTSKHFDFEWNATISSRMRGSDCPFLSHRIWTGFNDLETLHPELAAQWHPTKNGKLTPRDVTSGSDRRVWWLMPYDDPKTGKHFDFEWEASVSSRVSGHGCPFLSGKRAFKGFDDLIK